MKPGQRIPTTCEHHDQSPAARAPTNFLGHLQERLGVDELTAAERLQVWLLTYEPGPTALQRASGTRPCGETVAA